MPGAARLNDIGSGHDCFPETPIIEGSFDVIINSQPAARQVMLFCFMLVPVPMHHMVFIPEKSPKVHPPSLLTVKMLRVLGIASIAVVSLSPAVATSSLVIHPIVLPFRTVLNRQH